MDLVRTAGIDRQVGVIARLLVDPGLRRQGIGAKLLDQARSHIVSLGLAPVLDVVAGASPAVSLYRRTGWMEIREVTFEAPGRTISELVFLAPS
jgi:ribosomal protein S18 acetylase RimI-like enzyme